MNITHRRIVPFTSLFLTGSDNFKSVSDQSVEWCQSDSFNPEGRIFVIDCEARKIIVINRNGQKCVHTGSDFSFFAMIRFVLKIKASISIDFCGTKDSRAFLVFSRSGRIVAEKGVFSFFFTSISYNPKNKDSLELSAPYLFNRPGNEKFGYRTTFAKKEVTASKMISELSGQQIEETILDLGQIPKNPDGKILWIPKRTTTKGLWKDFIILTYFAQDRNCTIDIHFNNEKMIKKFSSMFFIKGRKMDLDKYLNILECKEINEIVFTGEKINYPHIIFSFGFTNEYHSLFIKLKKTGERDRIATVSRIAKELI